jgi:hypothetical protein
MHNSVLRGAKCHSCQNCLAGTSRTIFWPFFSNKVFFVDGTNVSGGLCSFGFSTELVKKKVSEMFIFLNLTLHSFGPENFVSLGQIGKIQKGLIEEDERYKTYITHSQHAIHIGEEIV